MIISAAGDRQVVYPLLVNGRYRGALSYVLVESLQRNQPKLRDLAENTRRQIRQLQITGRLDGDQQPVFTITDNALLADKPLFVTWEETPIIALSNRLSPIKIQLRDMENKSAYRIGEKISYEVTTDAPGYLYLIVFSGRTWPPASSPIPKTLTICWRPARSESRAPRLTSFRSRNRRVAM